MKHPPTLRYNAGFSMINLGLGGWVLYHTHTNELNIIDLALYGQVSFFFFNPLPVNLIEEKTKTDAILELKNRKIK